MALNAELVMLFLVLTMT